ncbi:hypothetical protein HanIR_Chr02g0063851 [Helianthus annuus]|nr:hypothetical protein HanIR_Chr02g0063851 [Helianthus annuus]
MCVCVRREEKSPVEFGCWVTERTSRACGGRCGGPAPGQAGPQPAPYRLVLENQWKVTIRSLGVGLCSQSSLVGCTSSITPPSLKKTPFYSSPV